MPSSRSTVTAPTAWWCGRPSGRRTTSSPSGSRCPCAASPLRKNFSKLRTAAPMLATLRPVLQWGEGGEAAPGGRRLRALPWSTAVVWGVAIVVALTVATPEPALAALALLPTAAVPGGMLIDVCRLHRRVRADAAELEAELGLLREAQQ